MARHLGHYHGIEDRPAARQSVEIEQPKSGAVGDRDVSENKNDTGSLSGLMVKLRGVDLEVPREAVESWAEIEGRRPVEVVDPEKDKTFVEGPGYVD
jgi:hypothetical protein